VYWVIPPLSGMFCNFGNAWAMNLLEWNGWITGTLPGLYPGQLGFIDWRFPFGGEQYSQAFVFDDGAHKVRHDDCVHFVTRGNEVAADAAVLAIQHEWTLPTPPASATTPPTLAGEGSRADSAAVSARVDAALTRPGVEASINLGFVGRALIQAHL